MDGATLNPVTIEYHLEPDLSPAGFIDVLLRSTQRRGIGRELIRRTHEAGGLHTHLILLAAPEARSYYLHIGMESHDSCWVIRRKTSV